MNIFDYQNYQKYLNDWLFLQPKQGHGLLKVWAEQMRVHSTLLSQILGGKKHLSLEQADRLTEILNLTDVESEYFLLLLLFERAGSQNLQKKLKKRILEAQKKSNDISQRIKVQTSLTEESKAQFYSSWIYTAIRNLSALPSIHTTEDMASFLGLPREIVQHAVEFLLEKGLCVQTPKGLSYGPSRTHVGAESPWVNQHHRNWRERASQKMLLKRDADLFFSFPMSISRKDAEKVRRLVPTWIDELHQIVGPSPSETVRCLNIDYFEY